MRSTYAIQDSFQFRLKATASLLGISESSLKIYLKESGIEIKRANSENPNSPAVRLFTIEDVFKFAQYRRDQGLVKRLGEPIFVAIELIKGGVGKSTTCAEVGTQLALEGYKVLMIDLDVQANLSQLMGYEADFELSEAADNGLTGDAIVQHTFDYVVQGYLQSGRNPISDMSKVIKKPFGEAGPHVICADTFLNDMEERLFAVQGDRALAFRRLFRDSAAGKIPGFNVADYDFVLMDCPPSVSYTTRNAIAIADVIVAPMRLDSFGVKGMARLLDEVGAIAEREASVRPDIVILPTHFSSNLSRVARMQQKLQAYAANLSPTVISASEQFPKSQEYYLPLTLQNPTSPPVGEYRAFTEFLLARAMKKAAQRKGGN